MIRGLIILHWVAAILISETLVYALFLLLGGNCDRAAFAGGLAVIGAAMALLGIPISLKITKPLEGLEDAALRIADGDLSARATLTGKHIIGKQLATAFNVMAEKVERMVRGGKELTANMSHELRSPLARIRVAGECLKESLERGKPEDAREMLEAMWEDIEEADRMIGRILELSKVDLHESPSVADLIAPAEIVERLARTLSTVARSKGINVGLDLDGTVRTTGNKELLRSAMGNMLENALKYTAPGGAVWVTVKEESGDALITVTNSFDPLEPDELEAIFKPFHRGRTSNGDGSGLGLSIVRKIAEIHHGEVVAGNVPEGFRIRLRLPSMAEQIRTPLQ